MHPIIVAHRDCTGSLRRLGYLYLAPSPAQHTRHISACEVPRCRESKPSLFTTDCLLGLCSVLPALCSTGLKATNLYLIRKNIAIASNYRPPSIQGEVVAVCRHNFSAHVCTKGLSRHARVAGSRSTRALTDPKLLSSIRGTPTPPEQR